MEQNYSAIDRAFAKLEEEIREGTEESYYVLAPCQFGPSQRMVKVAKPKQDDKETTDESN